ncbi:hypothetical protein CBR_g45501 [Chara braunii]|uniref:No apical meristem-associated C-terminal domain-containing protein n=1 Tax=Chara braunii TaxID=69332 RepID=A0A388LYW1_CHABU|nr:hypothetical protein CBR_g45501 [Chara braunii]|eukprot:GBG87443.1 hypothetical protein CBR_g45501 [Chara braunii]
MTNGRQASMTAGASNRQRTAGSVAKQVYDPMLYAHLPSHEIPLPTSDDEGEDVRSPTVPLGSGSTQDWAATQSYGGRRAETPWSYTSVTSMLNEGLCDNDGNAVVDLSFQLSSSSGAAATHTRIINPHTYRDCAEQTMVGPCGPRDVGLLQTLREGGRNRYAIITCVVKRIRDFAGTAATGGHVRGRFQHLSDRKDYFKLASSARRSEGFNFVMDQSVYDEMEAMTKGNHTIHPKNLEDTGAPRGVQMLAGAGAGGESMGSKEGGEPVDEEQGPTKDSTFSARSVGGSGKRKNMRQQTFEAVAEVMDKHGTLMACTMDSASKRQCSMILRQCEILESEVEVQRKHYAAAAEAS